jgi:hypothetical protein
VSKRIKHEVDAFLAHHGYAHHGRRLHRKIHEAPTGRLVYAEHERHHHITTSGRRALPASLFALPPTDKEIRRGIAGRVPFDTKRRAKSALARLSMMLHKRHITAAQRDAGRRKILAYWPSID